MDSTTVVAIPARDEADRIETCLTALSRQTHPPRAVVLLLNNCADETAAIARSIATGLPYHLELIDQTLPPAQSNAGYARRLAMQAAAALAGPDGVLMTTDADALVAPDWVSRNLRALRAGADVVCGRAIIDATEAAAIPAHLHADDALECELIALIDSLAWLLDPEPHDPIPRHTEASGASLAVSAWAFRRVGGIPAIPSGEDRAFVRALWMLDARIRHDPSIQVSVSGRIVGRAPGGMADAIRRRIAQQDEFTDDQVEPATDVFRRYSLRQRVRRAWRGQRDATLARDLDLSLQSVLDALSHRFFGAVWADLEATSPVLARKRVRFADLRREIDAAEALLSKFAEPEILAAD